MAYSVPSVSQFKAQFPRDFPYAVPAWGAAGTIVRDAITGAVTAITIGAGGQGYKAAPRVTIADRAGSGFTGEATVQGGAVVAVNVTAAGSLYGAGATLEFNGGAGDDTDLSKVRDADIVGAQVDSLYNIAQGLFEDEAVYHRGFGYLTAHNLVEKLLMAGEGIFSQYNWLTASKSVGGVSEAFTVPDIIKKSPWLSGLSKTRYGAAYIQIISPYLIGNMSVHRRVSLP